MAIPSRRFYPKQDMGVSCGTRSYASAGLIGQRPNLYIIRALVAVASMGRRFPSTFSSLLVL